jgi:hypothetical protein
MGNPVALPGTAPSTQPGDAQALQPPRTDGTSRPRVAQTGRQEDRPFRRGSALQPNPGRQKDRPFVVRPIGPHWRAPTGLRERCVGNLGRWPRLVWGAPLALEAPGGSMRNGLGICARRGLGICAHSSFSSMVSGRGEMVWAFVRDSRPRSRLRLKERSAVFQPA